MAVRTGFVEAVLRKTSCRLRSRCCGARSTGGNPRTTGPGARSPARCWSDTTEKTNKARLRGGAQGARAGEGWFKGGAGEKTEGAARLKGRQRTLLVGKRLFHDAADPRLARDGYIACSNCHPDGDEDGLVWDFTDRGEGGITIDFRFTPGGMPTRAGLVWTDGEGGVSFEAFDAAGQRIGLIGPFSGNGFPDLTVANTTGEDRFFGAVSPTGISRIRVFNSLGGVEIDHVQYGR
ncbi:MAG: hypothetical protein JNJ54_01585 [Myxococcaceae bacterium]|nr:hypothetical protein [Myxococcaceae bacterium]